MKFWRLTLLSAFSFLGIATTVLYTSCTEDPCTELKCRNGGSCANGYCSCPNGFEGPQCENATIQKYTGAYFGITKIGTKPAIIDSAAVGPEGATSIQAIVATQGDIIVGTVKGSNQLIATAKTPGDFGSITMNIETNWNRTGTNKMTLYVEKFVNNEKIVYTFIGETRVPQ
jgi:hypothetical protein